MADDYFKGSKLYWRENRKQWQGILYYTDESGKQKQKSKLFGSKKRAAQQAFEEWKAELNRKARLVAPKELIREPKDKTVGDRVREHLEYLETEASNGNIELSTLTAKRQQAELYIFKEPIAQIPYKKLSKEDILDWEEGLRARGIKNNTIVNPYSIMRRMYNLDIEHGKIEDTPFRFLHSPKAEKRNVNYATDATLRKLVQILDRQWREDKGNPDTLCYYLALYTGMRSEEICGLTWKDVHIPQGIIEVTQAIGRIGNKGYVKPPKNETSRRRIPIIPELAELLRTRKKRVCWDNDVEEPNPNWFVVGDRDTFKLPQYATQNFGRVCRRNNVIGSEGRYLTLHGLRDTLATVGVQERTIDIKSLSAILGHSNTAMTLNTYAGFGDNAMREAGMRGIGDALRRKVESDD